MEVVTMEQLKSRGVPDRLKGPVQSGARPKGGGIPAAFENTIRGAETAGEEGVQSGAEGLVPQHPPGSKPGNLPPGIAALIPGPGVNVP
jgi:hypothetical protein